jgi:hypothetical protein
MGRIEAKKNCLLYISWVPHKLRMRFNTLQLIQAESFFSLVHIDIMDGLRPCEAHWSEPIE